MKPFNYTKQQKLFKKATKVIPCGIYGHYSPAPLVPPTAYPFYTEKAKGANFWDLDGNKYIDYMCAYGPMVHGYANEKIDSFASKFTERGNCTTGAPPIMVELAETIVDMTEGMDWAFFAKNGSDVTDYAVMIARDATGRKKILTYNGCYHGKSSWSQGLGHHGVIEEDVESILKVDWNNYKDFERVVQDNRSEIAALIASPYLVPVFEDHEFPADGYWEKVEKLCKQEGIIIISDDIRHGFRVDIRGSHVKYGYNPDLVCYCKAIANGYPISACLGNEDMKPFASKVFQTGSYWYQSEPMAGALATLKEHKRINTPKICNEIGSLLLDGLVKIAESYDYDLKISGEPALPYLRITNDESLMLHQDWCAESTRRGAYFTPHHNWFISTAHTQKDIKKTLEIADEAFKAVKKKYGNQF